MVAGYSTCIAELIELNVRSKRPKKLSVEHSSKEQACNAHSAKLWNKFHLVNIYIPGTVLVVMYL